MHSALHGGRTSWYERMKGSSVLTNLFLPVFALLTTLTVEECPGTAVLCVFAAIELVVMALVRFLHAAEVTVVRLQ